MYVAVELKLSGQQFQSDKRKKALTEIVAQLGPKYSGLKVENYRNVSVYYSVQPIKLAKRLGGGCVKGLGGGYTVCFVIGHTGHLY